jgi:hypothetical protein
LKDSSYAANELGIAVINDVATIKGKIRLRLKTK